MALQEMFETTSQMTIDRVHVLKCLMISGCTCVSIGVAVLNMDRTQT